MEKYKDEDRLETSSERTAEVRCYNDYDGLLFK